MPPLELADGQHRCPQDIPVCGQTVLAVHSVANGPAAMGAGPVTPAGSATFLAIWHGMSHSPRMKTMIAMDSFGRLVLPKSIRQSLNTPPTALFEAEIVGNRLELKLAAPESGKLRQRGKLLVVPKQGVAIDAVQAVEQTRRDR